jgi:hypothetical protein
VTRWVTLKGWTKTAVKTAKAAWKAGTHSQLVGLYFGALALHVARDEFTTVWVVEDCDGQLGYLYQADFDVCPTRTDFARLYGYDRDGRRVEV